MTDEIMTPSISCVISAKHFYNNKTKSEIEVELRKAIPTNSKELDLSWHQLVALDGSGDERWEGRITYEV